MSFMFNGCSSLEYINLSSFNTNKVNNMRAMLCPCSSIKSLDISSFNTSNANNMCFIFFGTSFYKILTYLILI